jgi:aerobic-type carbon monoxide dehydrogenase small subunit (CoxS/CutS family)
MQSRLSRRSFLLGSALSTAALGLADSASAGTAQAGPASASGGSAPGLAPPDAPPAAASAALGAPGVFGPEALALTLSVNGQPRPLAVEPRMTLAEALRGPLGLTGTKIACNRGACSACTVWLDGTPVCSCMTLAIEVGARQVTTIEGLANGQQLHPVQQAFIEHDAMQCGFCTPGMVMSCAALLEHTPHPSAEQVQAAISGHYCRCGTYPHVLEATLSVSRAAARAAPRVVPKTTKG